jgi:hypothetical protein
LSRFARQRFKGGHTTLQPVFRKGNKPETKAGGIPSVLFVELVEL